MIAIASLDDRAFGNLDMGGYKALFRASGSSNLHRHTHKGTCMGILKHMNLASGPTKASSPVLE